MFLRYKGKTPNFVFKGIDFSKGPAEVDDETGMAMLVRNPNTFTKVVKAAKPAKPAKPAAKPVAKPAK